MSQPSDRYVRLETKVLPSGRTVYKSARPKSVIVDQLTDISIPATDVARMDVLANNVYGSAQDWWRIASANKLVNGSLYMCPGTKITIPRA